MDGINDGSLLQAYRYALDAAGLDFYANSEHNFLGGPDDEYHDFLLQQMADNFHLPGKFVPLFAYERSVTFPNGHRNILFAKRGVRPFRVSRQEFGGGFPFSSDSVTDRYANPEPVGTKDLYAYLKANDGISIPHTSSSVRMGTDWRDNDPDVEPLVEIYQGDRYSAEYEGAPRGAISGNPSSAPGGFQSEGVVWNAWAKGYKLGVQAASDHVSTHISIACTISEDGSRAGLIEAMRKRHSYAGDGQHRPRLQDAIRWQGVPAGRHRDRQRTVSTLDPRDRNRADPSGRHHQESRIRSQPPESGTGCLAGVYRQRSKRGRELLLRAHPAGRRAAGLVLAHLDH